MTRPKLGPSNDKCYACDRVFRRNSRGNIAYHPEVLTIDGQRQMVGADCYKRIIAAGANGFQPALGGPRLFAEQYAPQDALRLAGIIRIVTKL